LFKNLVNRYDVLHLLRGLRSGSIWRALRGLLRPQQAVESSWERTEGPPSYFWNIPAVCRRANRLITGDPDLDYTNYVAHKYLAPLQPLRGISLGCGTGEKELRWTNLCDFSRLDAYDISTSRIAHAQDRAEAAGRTELHYHVSDLSGIDWPRAEIDIVFGDQSLHHLSPLEPLLLEIRRALKPTGYLVASEFIGPTRFQWTDRQLEVINATLALLPARYRRRWTTGRIKRRVHRPSRLAMQMGDPSEAIESARIAPLLERHFEVVERRDYGGTIVHMLFDDIAHNFLDEAGGEKDGQARRLIEMCFQIEDTLLEVGEIESDFALFVCRPPATR
jgi:SAM-dependent methyltransferase